MIIYTEYKGPSAGGRGSSIYVTSSFAPGKRMPYDYGARSDTDQHARAAKEYASQAGINGRWAGSSVKGGGFVFVRLGIAGFVSKKS